MIVEDPRTETANGVTRFSSTVIWEDHDREPFEMFFEVRENDAWRLAPSVDAFRVPAAVAALHDGERRIAGGGPICPALFNGLSCSLRWLARWSEAVDVPSIDMPWGCDHPESPAQVTGAFLSGGVDSSALLASNHDAYSPGHPLRISLGIVVVGIQRSRWVRQTRDQQFQAVHEDLRQIESGFGIELVPVATNLQDIEKRGSFWSYEYQGAALAGVGHLFSPSISDLDIASTWEIGFIDRWGSHPLLDPGYGSHSLRIWHELAHMGRLNKTRLVVSRPALFDTLNVCNKEEAGDFNCGRCEKCLRTMLALEALGVLHEAATFDRMTLEPSDFGRIRILDPGLEGEYLELLDPLRMRGREDLAAVIERKIRNGRIMRRKSVARARFETSKARKRIRRALRRRKLTETRSAHNRM